MFVQIEFIVVKYRQDIMQNCKYNTFSEVNDIFRHSQLFFAVFTF